MTSNDGTYKGFTDDAKKFLALSEEDRFKLSSEKVITLSEIPPLKHEGIGSKLSTFAGDITQLQIGAIVNAANRALAGGGGVDGSIHRKAGSQLLKAETSNYGGCIPGKAVITSGFKLPSKYVIHTVGPQGEFSDTLESCYKSCLELAVKHKVRTIAFPCISTGVYGYPNDKAAKVAITSVRDWLNMNDHMNLIDRIIFCLFLKVDVELYQKYLPELL